MAKLVKNNYGNDNFENILNEIYYKRGVCIELNDSTSIVYSTDNLNRGCLVEKDNPSLVYYKGQFMESDQTDITFKIINEQLKSETLVYGLELDNNLYAFLNTSIDPIDSTIVILKNQLIIVTIIVLILSFVIGFYISKKISNPITSLNKSAKRLASGDYDVKFENQSDIEEIDELANTLNSARDALSKNDELRRELMANVSHDLKTPLTMIKAYAEMVRDITYKDKDKREENVHKHIKAFAGISAGSLERPAGNKESHQRTDNPQHHNGINQIKTKSKGQQQCAKINSQSGKHHAEIPDSECTRSLFASHTHDGRSGRLRKSNFRLYAFNKTFHCGIEFIRQNFVAGPA